MTAVKNFVVLGMHRSATSLVAKALVGEGREYRGIGGADHNNPYGYWEDHEVLNLNDAILSLAGGSWVDPPPVQRIAAQKEWADDSIEQLLENKYGGGPWVIKEPRLVLTWNLWKPHFDARDTQVVLVYRPRHLILESLLTRGGASPEALEASLDEHLRRLRGIAADLYGNGVT